MGDCARCAACKLQFNPFDSLYQAPCCKIQTQTAFAKVRISLCWPAEVIKVYASIRLGWNIFTLVSRHPSQWDEKWAALKMTPRLTFSRHWHWSIGGYWWPARLFVTQILITPTRGPSICQPNRAVINFGQGEKRTFWTRSTLLRAQNCKTPVSLTFEEI